MHESVTLTALQGKKISAQKALWINVSSKWQMKKCDHFVKHKLTTISQKVLAFNFALSVIF